MRRLIKFTQDNTKHRDLLEAFLGKSKTTDIRDIVGDYSYMTLYHQPRSHPELRKRDETRPRLAVMNI